MDNTEVENGQTKSIKIQIWYVGSEISKLVAEELPNCLGVGPNGPTPNLKELIVSGREGVSLTGFDGYSESSELGRSESLDKGISKTGNKGTSISAFRGISVSGDDGKSISGLNGISSSLFRGYSVSGAEGVSISEYRGRSESLDYGVSISGSGGVSISGNHGFSISAKNGTSISGYSGVSVSGFGGRVRSGPRGLLVLEDESGKKFYKSVASRGAKANVFYELLNGKFIKSSSQHEI